MGKNDGFIEFGFSDIRGKNFKMIVTYNSNTIEKKCIEKYIQWISNQQTEIYFRKEIVMQFKIFAREMKKEIFFNEETSTYFMTANCEELAKFVAMLNDHYILCSYFYEK